MARGESLRAGKGRRALSYKFRASVESWKAQFAKGHSGEAYGTNTWVICSKKVILCGPECLEGQKIREAQQAFSTFAHANLSRVLHLFYRGGQCQARDLNRRHAV
jgi:hypothetical protein